MMKDLIKELYTLPDCRVIEIKVSSTFLNISGGEYPENDETEDW